MALSFDRCIFEILAKLGASELTALCEFIDGKVNLLERELNKNLAFTNVLQDQFNDVEAQIRAGEAAFDEFVSSSTLLNVARTLSPNCGSLASVFQGALDLAGITATSVNDIEYLARQILTKNGLIQTAKNELTDLMSALRDLCRIVQLIILENAENFTDFAGSGTKGVTTLLPKG